MSRSNFGKFCNRIEIAFLDTNGTPMVPKFFRDEKYVFWAFKSCITRMRMNSRSICRMFENLKILSNFCKQIDILIFQNIVQISVFLLKSNPWKNRSITNSYIYSHCFVFFEKQLFFLGFFKISKNRPKFERILLKFYIFNSPNCLRFQSIFMQSIFQKIQILKQVQNGPVNRDKKKHWFSLIRFRIWQPFVTKNCNFFI